MAIRQDLIRMVKRMQDCNCPLPMSGPGAGKIVHDSTCKYSEPATKPRQVRPISLYLAIRYWEAWHKTVLNQYSEIHTWEELPDDIKRNLMQCLEALVNDRTILVSPEGFDDANKRGLWP